MADLSDIGLEVFSIGRARGQEGTVERRPDNSHERYLQPLKEACF